MTDAAKIDRALDKTIAGARNASPIMQRMMALDYLEKHGEDAEGFARLKADMLMNEAESFLDLAVIWRELADLIHKELTPTDLDTVN